MQWTQSGSWRSCETVGMSQTESFSEELIPHHKPEFVWQKEAILSTANHQRMPSVPEPFEIVTVQVNFGKARFTENYPRQSAGDSNGNRSILRESEVTACTQYESIHWCVASVRDRCR